MSLISLLLALSLERARQHGNHWLWHKAFSWWSRLWINTRWHWQLVFAVIVPSLGVYLLQQMAAGLMFGLPSLLLFVAVPLITLGCPPLQGEYRQYIRAASRNQYLACEQFNQQLLSQVHPRHQIPVHQSPAITTGTQLVWLNYRYYFAIIFYFVVAGPAGAVFYACCRELHASLATKPEHQQSRVHTAMHILDWIPSRCAGLAYAIVGDSAKAWPLWKEALKDAKHSNGYWLSQVAIAAGDFPQEASPPVPCASTTTLFVGLAKRSILLSLTVIAVLTIVGAL